MKSLTLLITGGIGSGKSLVSRYMEELGVPVYDSDSRTKALYEGELLSRLETALGARLRTEEGRFDKLALARLIFSDNVNMSKMEQVALRAPEELRVRRACERDGVDEAAVRERIRNQSVDVSAADYIIDNDGTSEELRVKTEAVLREIQVVLSKMNEI